MELIKDYNVGIHYHPGKANIVADALSQNPASGKKPVPKMRPELAKKFALLNLLLVPEGKVAQLELQPPWTGISRKLRKVTPALRA